MSNVVESFIIYRHGQKYLFQLVLIRKNNFQHLPTYINYKVKRNLFSTSGQKPLFLLNGQSFHNVKAVNDSQL